MSRKIIGEKSMKKHSLIWIMALLLCGCNSPNQVSNVLNEEENAILLKNNLIQQEENKAIVQEVANHIETVATKPEQAVITSALEGKIISIDAGHQAQGSSIQEPVGPGSSETKARVSSGTKGVATGKYEYELNLEVALKLQKALEEKGAIVYMVRETNDVDISNKERAELANSVHADLSLRIHADGMDDSSVNGFSVLVPDGRYISDEVITKSYEIAQSIEKSLAATITNRSRGIVRRSDLTGFNWSTVPAVLVEMGFMSNPEEDKRMSSIEFQEEFVAALIQGLELYYSEKA